MGDSWETGTVSARRSILEAGADPPFGQEDGGLVYRKNVYSSFTRTVLFGKSPNVSPSWPPRGWS